MRYVIEQKIIGRKPSRPVLRGLSEIEVAAMYWPFTYAQDQQKFLRELIEGRVGAKLTLNKMIDDANSAYHCLSQRSSQIFYFYAHGHTALPDGERYGVTVKDFVELYEKLSNDSPTKRDWASIYGRIKNREYQADESWIELSTGRVQLPELYKKIEYLPTRPLVILNMCDSAQVTPSLADSFIDFFLSRGAAAVIGTECSIRPAFADFVGRELLQAALKHVPIGEALRKCRVEAAERKNLLGLAYTLFGDGGTAFPPPSD